MSTWGYCDDPYGHRRDGERAAERGYLRYDEREQYGSRSWPNRDDACSEEFWRGYRDAERREEAREEERRAEEAAERRRHEACLEEERQQDAYYEQQAYEAAQEQPPDEPPPLAVE